MNSFYNWQVNADLHDALVSLIYDLLQQVSIPRLGHIVNGRLLGVLRHQPDVRPLLHHQVDDHLVLIWEVEGALAYECSIMQSSLPFLVDFVDERASTSDKTMNELDKFSDDSEMTALAGLDQIYEQNSNTMLSLLCAELSPPPCPPSGRLRRAAGGCAALRGSRTRQRCGLGCSHCPGAG